MFDDDIIDDPKGYALSHVSPRDLRHDLSEEYDPHFHSFQFKCDCGRWFYSGIAADETELARHRQIAQRDHAIHARVSLDPEDINLAESLVSTLLEDDYDDLDEDPKAYALTHGVGRRIAVAYAEYVPSDDPDDCEPVEYGWENEEGEEMEVDEWDDEGETPVTKAVKFLGEKVPEVSASFFHPGVWYSEREENMRTGGSTERTFHLKGFTPEEEEAVYAGVKRYPKI